MGGSIRELRHRVIGAPKGVPPAGRPNAKKLDRVEAYQRSSAKRVERPAERLDRSSVASSLRHIPASDAWLDRLVEALDRASRVEILADRMTRNE